MSKYGVFLVRIFAYSVWIRKNTDQKKLRIWTLFTQWRQNVNGEIMQIWTYKKDITSYQHSLLNYTNNYCQMYANSKCYITGLNFWRWKMNEKDWKIKRSWVERNFLSKLHAYLILIKWFYMKSPLKNFVKIFSAFLLTLVLVITCLGGRFGIIFKNCESDLYQKSPELSMWSLVNTSNKHFLLELTSFNSGQLQISGGQLQNSGQLQNNTVNGAMSITINRAINKKKIIIFQVKLVTPVTETYLGLCQTSMLEPLCENN